MVLEKGEGFVGVTEGGDDYMGGDDGGFAPVEGGEGVGLFGIGGGVGHRGGWALGAMWLGAQAHDQRHDHDTGADMEGRDSALIM